MEFRARPCTGAASWRLRDDPRARRGRRVDSTGRSVRPGLRLRAVIHLLTKAEFRAVLAHELGHFAGGDTRLVGVAGYTHALFRSVLVSTHARPAFARRGSILGVGAAASANVGEAVARFYARLYFRVTHALSRRQELAADELGVARLGLLGRAGAPGDPLRRRLRDGRGPRAHSRVGV